MPKGSTPGRRLRSSGKPLPLRAVKPHRTEAPSPPLQFFWKVLDAERKLQLVLGCATCRRAAVRILSWEEYLGRDGEPGPGVFEVEKTLREELRAELSREVKCRHAARVAPLREDTRGLALGAARRWRGEDRQLKQHYEGSK